jgi:hypothetical protein
VTPDATAAVAGHHCKPNGELNNAEQALEHDVPGWAIGRQDPAQLQDGYWHAQHTEKKGEQDQPEGPAPSPHDPDCEQSNEARKRGEEAEFQQTAVTGRQAEGWS